MALNELIERIDKLQSEIDSHGKLGTELLKKIQYRFRLDWNYHSNAMEGGTLTLQETRSVMIDISVKGKPFKDLAEMRGHDNVVTEIFKMGKGELRLSEKRIKDVHAAIIHEDDPELKKLVGRWKVSDNHVLNYRGEKFVFTSHSDVAEEMHSLIDWLNAQSDKLRSKSSEAMHPVLIAFEFHLRFVSIHPFYDGNGRTSRIFMNLILISFGYPPVVVKESEKDEYNKYLADIQAYGGNPALLNEFLCEKLIRSEQLVLDAIAGKDISEPDDLDKKIAMLKAEIAEVDKDNEVQLRFDKNTFRGIYDGWVSELIRSLIRQIRKFDDMFADPSHHVHVNLNQHHGFGGQSYAVELSDKSEKDVIEELRKEIFEKASHVSSDTIITVQAKYGTFKKGALKMPFGCNYHVELRFGYIDYEIYVPKFYIGDGPLIDHSLIQSLRENPLYKHVYFGEEGGVFPGGKSEGETPKVAANGEKLSADFSREEILSGEVKDRGMHRFSAKRLLHKPCTTEEIQELARQFGHTIFDHIDYCTKKQGIR